MTANAPVLWTPPPARKQASNMAAFVSHVNAAHNAGLPPLQYAPLWRWSVERPDAFWRAVWDFAKIIGEKRGAVLQNAAAMPGARFFNDAKLNYAENLLRNADERPAVFCWDEGGKETARLSRRELREQTLRLAGWLRAQGLQPGDRVCAYLPNTHHTVVALLATAAAGGVFSSCSPDFGASGAAERFAQIEPKFLIVANGYRYGGKTFDRRKEARALAAALPTVRAVLCAPILANAKGEDNWHSWQSAQNCEPAAGFEPMPFNAPLAVLYSSGTTGAPKCIAHGGGGTLLQHAKEHALHADIKAGDRVFYFTTCGWMMWNWLVSALAQEAAIVLYDGNPLKPNADALWNMAQAAGVSHFGASPKYYDALRLAKQAPAKTHSLPALRAVFSTGAPLLEEGFRYVYSAIKGDVHLASISGGTDIVSCFLLGNPFEPTRAGELQCAGLGMKMAVYNDAGKPVINEPGELVCEAPFPSMPVGFWGDASGEKYRAAYFERFAGVWTHGDRTTARAGGGFVIDGRSDATLNPGGARIGTAEIYRPLQAFASIADALAVGWQNKGEEKVVLFVVMANGAQLTEELQAKIRRAIRAAATPRHAPAKIIAVPDLPRTRSGKVSEIAARETICQRPVKNQNALANPEALAHFANLSQLQD